MEKTRKNKPLFYTILVVLVFIIGYYLFNYFFLYTNNAYLEANIVNIAAQVSGNATRVNVKDLQHVKAGDLLFSIEDSRYQQRLKLAKAEVAQTTDRYQQLVTKLSQIAFAIKKSQADEQFKQKEWQRYQKLKQQAFTSAEKANQVYSIWQQAKQNTNMLKQDMLSIKKQVGNNLNDFAPYQQAQAKLNLALINEKDTQQHAPVSGYVTALSLRKGDYIKTGQALFSIIEDNSWWVSARIKENDLNGIQPGRIAHIYTPANSKSLTGKIYGIGWGVNRRDASTQVRPSPLPYLPQHVNWIQLAQRFPVRINLINVPKNTALRVGATARVFIVRHHDQ